MGEGFLALFEMTDRIISVCVDVQPNGCAGLQGPKQLLCLWTGMLVYFLKPCLKLGALFVKGHGELFQFIE